MKRLIALTSIQFSVLGQLAEVKAGEPLVLSDEQQIAHLFSAQAVREPNDDEGKLFDDNTPAADGSAVGDSPDLSKLTKDDLLGYAAEKGVTVDPKATKADVINEIENSTKKGSEKS